MTGAGTYWRTVAYLRPEQVVGRVRFRLHRPKPDLRAAPALREAAGPWSVPAAREASLVGPGRLLLLNVERALDECGWDDPRIDRLWRYNQHYFDDLNAGGAAVRHEMQRALAQRWIEENPPARGTGWEPYPVSLRIVNWVKWFMAGTRPEAAWLHSLAVQARWLTQRLESHMLGNHLFTNAKALVFAGLYFQGPEANTWLEQGLSIIDRELPEQVLADGGQFERSPMYHALALEDLLDLLNIAVASAPTGSAVAAQVPRWREIATRMLFWLRCMTHPDGKLGLFNDTADGVAPPLSELERYTALLGVRAAVPPAQGITQLTPSGYVRVARGAALALLDVAPIGPDYLPGHAHADTLSFELSLGQRRVVVNGGTSCYGVGARRLYERGTAAHSTVQVAGRDSSEVWSGFRVGRRARPGEVVVNGWDVECGHDGYRYLPGAPEHRRRWQFDDNSLVVQDAVAPAPADAVARYHLAPGLSLHAAGDNAWLVMDGTRPVASVAIEVGTATLAASQHAPRFGLMLPAQSLVVTLAAGHARTRWSWNSDMLNST